MSDLLRATDALCTGGRNAPPGEPRPRTKADIIRNMAGQLAQWDYLLPGDYMPDPPLVRHWLFWKRPLPITQDLEVWAGMIARARSLMDLEAAAAAIDRKVRP